MNDRHTRHQCTADASLAFLSLGGGSGGGTPGSAPGQRVAGFPLLHDLLQALLGVKALEEREDEVIVAVRASLVVHLTSNATSQIISLATISAHSSCFTATVDPIRAHSSRVMGT